MTIQFTSGLNRWDPDGTYFGIMLDAGITPTADMELADLLPFESVAAGYARTADFTVTEFVDDDRLEARLNPDGLTGNNLEFGTLTADDPDPRYVVIVRKITDDTDSIALRADACEALKEFYPAIHVSSRGLMKSIPQDAE